MSTRARIRCGAALAILALALGAGGACAGGSSVPPIAPTPTNAYRPGRVVWHDLVTTDVEGARRFYGTLFGWQFENAGGRGSGYQIARLGGRPVAGIVSAREFPVITTQWVSYFSVRDVDSAAASVGAGGGRVFVSPTEIRGRGRAALVADPQGALFAVLHATGGDPIDAVPPINGFLWHELWTVDTTAATRFYTALMGYETGPAATPLVGPYTVLRRDGIPRAGMLRIPVPQVRPNWLPTVRVADVMAVVTRTPQLGGRVILAPRPELRRGTVAIIQDPGGAAVTVQQWRDTL